MAKKKIEKNRSINEMMGEQINDEETITMEEVIARMDKKKQEKSEKAKQKRKSFNKRIQNMATRKDNQFAEEQRKSEYLKAVNKMQGQKEQEER